jgi:hypothetical protein
VSSSHSEVDRYVIIGKLRDPIYKHTMGIKFAILHISLTTQDISNARLRTQGISYPHRCWTRNIQNHIAQNWLVNGVRVVVLYNLWCLVVSDFGIKRQVFTFQFEHGEVIWEPPVNLSAGTAGERQTPRVSKLSALFRNRRAIDKPITQQVAKKTHPDHIRCRKRSLLLHRDSLQLRNYSNSRAEVPYRKQSKF